MAVVGAAGVVAASGAVPTPELANGSVRLNSRGCAGNNCGGTGFKSTGSKVVAGAGVAMAVVGSALQHRPGGPDKARLRSHRVARSKTNPWRLQRADADESTPAGEAQTAPITDEPGDEQLALEIGDEKSSAVPQTQLSAETKLGG